MKKNLFRVLILGLVLTVAVTGLSTPANADPAPCLAQMLKDMDSCGHIYDYWWGHLCIIEVYANYVGCLAAALGV